MTTINRNALVPYTAADMFTLVNDLRAYPDFLPWCDEVKIHDESPDEIKATVHFSRRGLSAAFTTRNRLQINKMIEMRLLDGPFRHLQGFWRFEPVGDAGCKIRLDMEFEIANPVLRLTIGPLFKQIANSLMDAFIARARDVHGR
ncbi:MAG: type II toxin-antitoxin system RatA family toxin [Gammaproteobacteria bacterium]|nr:type II toxin-antitoxin system RatA family toxin [Gammaproteobacteria bacterium]